MTAFRTITATAVSLPSADVDTDIIFPARFLLLTDKTGLGRYAFHDRVDLAVKRGTQILVTGDNFGCGSSREQAPWALKDLGIRVLIATGFGEIFQSNCFKNGMLPIVLEADLVAELHAAAQTGAEFTVNLQTNELRFSDGDPISFAVSPARREALLNGWDEISRIRSNFAAAIDAFETRQRETQPWLWAHEPIRTDA